jgi:hypothetical protein
MEFNGHCIIHLNFTINMEFNGHLMDIKIYCIIH